MKKNKIPYIIPIIMIIIFIILMISSHCDIKTLDINDIVRMGTEKIQHVTYDDDNNLYLKTNQLYYIHLKPTLLGEHTDLYVRNLPNNAEFVRRSGRIIIGADNTLPSFLIKWKPSESQITKITTVTIINNSLNVIKEEQTIKIYVLD